MPLLKDFKYHTPSTLKDALGLLKKLQAPVVLAGGTFLLNFLKKTSKVPTDIIGLKKISSLCGIKDLKTSVVLGAMTTIAEIVGSKAIHDSFSSLTEACANLATTPLRHMATIGGNVASRFSWVDLPAVLISLDASLTYVTPTSEKTISITDFLTKKPSEKFIITKVILPKEELKTYYFRHTKTMDVDVLSCAMAFSASIKKSALSGVKLVVNTSISFPVILEKTNKVLEGCQVHELKKERVQDALKQDLLGSKLDEYRLCLLAQDIEKLIELLKTA